MHHLFGADGRGWYNFWSGFGADLGQLALFGAAIGLYRRHNCHVHGCWRIGKQPLQHDGATWMVCHKHHPADQLTSATMARLADEHRLGGAVPPPSPPTPAPDLAGQTPL